MASAENSKSMKTFVSLEVISFEPVSSTSDMESVGVICYVLLSGLSLFLGNCDLETFLIISGIAYDFDDGAFDATSEEAKDFISKLPVKHQVRNIIVKYSLRSLLLLLNVMLQLMWKMTSRWCVVARTDFTKKTLVYY